MALLSPEDTAYLRQQAASRGMNGDDLLKAINYESSGRTDVWGGKGNKYFGLIQFGPSERAQFGVDTQNPNARNQIDAAFNFLQARGFKPGMGLLDLYSTINAGSPGHYNASDGNGTVASHVARMSGGAEPRAAISGSAPVLQAPFQHSGMIAPTPVGNVPAASETDIENAAPAQVEQTAVRGLLAKLMPQAEQQQSELPKADMPTPSAAPVKHGRGLAFQQLKIKTPSFRKTA